MTRPTHQSEAIRAAYNLLTECTLCPRACRVNRPAGERGYCGAGHELVVSSAGPHFGEEAVLVGRAGSGTIFLAGCNLKCLFCQNYDISHFMQGKIVSVEEMVQLMLKLQQMGCHNINLVTPTHFTPPLMEAIAHARQKGLTIPIVYNCGGYESVETLKLLAGFIEIYMPDIKYSRETSAEHLSQARDYFKVAKLALKEMHRQVGDLVIQGGIAQRGLLIRHLVLPDDMAGSQAIIDFIAEEISPHSYINIMDQYYPHFRASRYPPMNRRITTEEFRAVSQYAQRKGLRLDRRPGYVYLVFP